MSEPFTRVGKQILANGCHYADGADETAAQFLLDALNAHVRAREAVRYPYWDPRGDAEDYAAPSIINSVEG